MRPRPLAAGFQRCRPGSVSRSAKLGSSASAIRDILRAIPLAVTDLTNSRREMLIVPRLLPFETELWTRYSAIRCWNYAVRVQRALTWGQALLHQVWTSRKIGQCLCARPRHDQRRPLVRAEWDLRG